ncbi:MAG: diguanylate cyclase [Arhodomonas sp.]|nr:diguanylate cyclase [Arhodomonas sp.]
MRRRCGFPPSASAPLEAARDGIGEYLTVSIGAYLAQPGEGAEAALSQADRALYAAKSAGRNTFRLAE